MSVPQFRPKQLEYCMQHKICNVLMEIIFVDHKLVLSIIENCG